MTETVERVGWRLWLRDHQPRTAAAISTRVVARVFPIVFSHISTSDEQVQKAVLVACRTLLAAVRLSYDSSALDLAATGNAVDELLSQRHALPGVSSVVAEAVAYAAKSRISGSSNGIESIDLAIRASIAHMEQTSGAEASETEGMMRGAVTRDIAGLERRGYEGHELLLRMSLAEDHSFKKVSSQIWEKVVSSDKASSPAWIFWSTFFGNLVRGAEFDQEMASRVLNIEEEYWRQGPEIVALEIERLRAELLSEKLPAAEQLTFNYESGKFDVLPAKIARGSLIDEVLGQAIDALHDVLAKPSNGLTDRSHEAVVLRRTFERYSDNPQRIEMDFTSVHRSLSRQISVSEYPASQENIALEVALREGAYAIRASHPEIKRGREILNQQAMLELSAADRSIVIEALPVLEAISEGALLADWSEDIDYLLEARFRNLQTTPKQSFDESDSIFARDDQKIRLFGRAARIMLILKATPELIHKIDQSATYKSARILTTIAALVALGIALIV